MSAFELWRNNSMLMNENCYGWWKITFWLTLSYGLFSICYCFDYAPFTHQYLAGNCFIPSSLFTSSQHLSKREMSEMRESRERVQFDDTPLVPQNFFSFASSWHSVLLSLFACLQSCVFIFQTKRRENNKLLWVVRWPRKRMEDRMLSSSNHKNRCKVSSKSDLGWRKTAKRYGTGRLFISHNFAIL